MENKNQTAVEFLEEKYRPKGYITAEEFEQAKEMEKEQIINSYRIGKVERTLPNEILTTGEQYYKKKYEVTNDNNKNTDNLGDY
jgi:hypothetical protein